MKETAITLKQEGSTQQEIGDLLGVDQSTVSVWLNVNNMNDNNVHIPDARVKIPKKEHKYIADRADEGETQKQIAADYGVDRSRISQIVNEQESKRQFDELEDDVIDEESLDDSAVQPGQVWQLGPHRLACGDCNDPELMYELLQGEMPDVILTDPPYGMNLDTDYSKLPSTKPEGNKDYDPVIGDDAPFIYDNLGLECAEEYWFGADYYRKTIPDGGSWIVWDKRTEEKFDRMFGSAFELIWSKVKHKREIIRHNNTLFSGNKEAKNKVHPTTKPIKVIGWIIQNRTSKDDVIIDMYSGTGTTLIACEEFGRICRAIEIDPKYVDITIQRWIEKSDVTPLLIKE